MSQLDPAAGMRITTYIVSGHPRSGTSMMMHALVQGGLEPAYTPEWDARAANPNGYVQNPNGFYELGVEEQRHPWFPMPYWGKLIKAQYLQLVGLAPGRYRVVFMVRHPREIRMSYRALGEATGRQRLDWSTENDYYLLMKRFMAAAAMRVDMELLEISYSDVVASPLATFEKIRDFGFPIDPVKAANTIDSALYRHRATQQSAPTANERDADPRDATET